MLRIGMALSVVSARFVIEPLLRTLEAASLGPSECAGAGAGAGTRGRAANLSGSAGEALGNGASANSLLPATCSE